VEALHFSLVTMSTLGFGDIVPTAGWLRIVSPVEALLGFGLLSASISWLLTVYPVLLRRRSLAYELHLLRDASAEGTSLEPEARERLYTELTSRLVTVERDFVAFPIAYYFPERDSRFALAASMPYLLELAERSDRDDVPASLRLRATLLREAIDDFARTTAARFHGHASESTSELLEAYARDHYRSRDREAIAYDETA
jgi:hypothetical protein